MVFEEMFGNKSQYRVLHFGFEYITSELKGVIRGADDETFKMISKAPDFLLHDAKNRTLFLVECKYRSRVTDEELYKMAKQLDEKNWGLSKLFVASPEGFYYDDVDQIIANKGKCAELPHDVIGKSTQEKYLSQLLAMFETD